MSDIRSHGRSGPVAGAGAGRHLLVVDDDDRIRELLKESAEAQAELEAVLAGVSQIPPHQLDPVERAILLLSMYELRTKVDVPYRVVINEGIELAKRYGATDGHKFVNGVLDRAARTLRPHEQGARR
jgi:N utilization substance protein B